MTDRTFDVLQVDWFMSSTAPGRSSLKVLGSCIPRADSPASAAAKVTPTSSHRLGSARLDEWAILVFHMVAQAVSE